MIVSLINKNKSKFGHSKICRTDLIIKIFKMEVREIATPHKKNLKNLEKVQPQNVFLP